LLLKNFFQIVYTCLSREDIAQQICAIVPRWRFLGDFFASCVFQRAAYSRFQTCVLNCHTKATPCVEVWQTSNLQRLRLGEEK